MRFFQETQKFTQWWLHLIIWGILAFLLYCLYIWFVAKETVGNVSADGTTAQLLVIISTVLPLLLILSIRMETTIDEIGIHYRFLPFHTSKKTVRWADIEECFVRKYNPVSEYGGWGLRGTLGKNKAYNIKGNKGIQIKLKTGEKVLIGTQKDNEAQKVIERHYKK